MGSFEGSYLEVSNPSSATEALSGTTSLVVSNGVATFADLSINKAAAGYSLIAQSGPLGQDASTFIPGYDSFMACVDPTDRQEVEREISTAAAG